MILAAADPDTKATGVAVLDTETGHLYCDVIKASGRLAEHRRIPMAQAVESYFCGLHLDGLAIEWQHIRPHGERRPNDIMAVQAVAGMILASASPFVPEVNVWLPIPSQWRGTQKKEIVQERILAGLASSEIDLELLFEGISKADQSHAIDAIGLVFKLKEKLGV